MISFLFCFDDNFNLQGLTSINSLLRNVSKKINIYIIHNNISSIKNQIKILQKNKMLNEIVLYQFKKDPDFFPKITTHVSEATFYRLFMSEFIPSTIEKLVYLDADIICVNDPLPKIEHTFKRLEVEKTSIAALVENTRDWNPQLFENLGLKNDNQFNAGVLIINYKDWLIGEFQEKLLEIFNERHSKIFDYDQEILNIFFDDNFTKLDKSLNYQAIGREDYEYIKEIKKDAIFLHFLGKSKPWSYDGILQPASLIYQEEFKKLNIKKLHIEFKVTKTNIKNLIKIIFKLQFIRFKYPISYLLFVLRSLFKK